MVIKDLGERIHECCNKMKSADDFGRVRFAVLLSEVTALIKKDAEMCESCYGKEIHLLTVERMIEEICATKSYIVSELKENNVFQDLSNTHGMEVYKYIMKSIWNLKKVEQDIQHNLIFEEMLK